MRRAAKVDVSHVAIVETLRVAGCSVLSLAAVGDGVPDLLVWCPRIKRTLLMEVKPPTVPSHRGLRASQIQWAAAWRGEIVVVTTPIEALEAADGRGLSPEQYEAKRLGETA